MATTTQACFICDSTETLHHLYETVFVCCEHATPPEHEYPLFAALVHAAERKAQLLQAQGAA